MMRAHPLKLSIKSSLNCQGSYRYHQDLPRLWVDIHRSFTKLQKNHMIFFRLSFLNPLNTSFTPFLVQKDDRNTKKFVSVCTTHWLTAHIYCRNPLILVSFFNFNNWLILPSYCIKRALSLKYPFEFLTIYRADC